jgi:hypothetical protein
MLEMGCVILIAPIGFFYLFHVSNFFWIFLCIFGGLSLRCGHINRSHNNCKQCLVFHVLVTKLCNISTIFKMQICHLINTTYLYIIVTKFTSHTCHELLHFVWKKQRFFCSMTMFLYIIETCGTIWNESNDYINFSKTFLKH